MTTEPAPEVWADDGETAVSHLGLAAEAVAEFQAAMRAALRHTADAVRMTGGDDDNVRAALVVLVMDLRGAVELTASAIRREIFDGDADAASTWCAGGDGGC